MSLRSALGVQQAPPNTVLISLALFLTAFVMAPTLEKIYRDGIESAMEAEASARALTLALRDLVEAGLLTRRVIDSYPPTPQYQLAAKTRPLLPILRERERRKELDRVSAARRRAKKKAESR